MRWRVPPSPRTVVAEDGMTHIELVRRGPPWNYRLEKCAWFWKWSDVRRVTVCRWDLYTIDLIGMAFEFKDGGFLNVTEDNSCDFYATMERILPKALPGIVPSDHWYDNVYADPERQGVPTVLYEAPSPS